MKNEEKLIEVGGYGGFSERERKNLEREGQKVDSFLRSKGQKNLECLRRASPWTVGSATDHAC